MHSASKLVIVFKSLQQLHVLKIAVIEGQVQKANDKTKGML